MGEDANVNLIAEAPDHWRSTQVNLIQDKLTIPAGDRVKGPVSQIR